MAEKKLSLVDMLKAISEMTDADVVILRDAVMAECSRRHLTKSYFIETDHSIPPPRRPR